MQVSSKSVPKYRRKKIRDKFYAVVTLNGKDFYLGRHGSKASKVEYDRLIGEWLVGGRRHVQTTETLTVVELIALYMKFAKAHYRKNGKLTETYVGLKSTFRPLKEIYGKTPANEFGPKRLKALRLRMLEPREVDQDQTRVKRLARSTINAHCATIRRLFRWAAAEELIPAAVPQALAMVRGLERGRTEAPEPKPVLPVAEVTVEATIPHLPQVVADMVKLQRLTGMRPGEVCLIRPIDLNKAKDVWIFTPESHKNEHHELHRPIPIGPQAQNVLRPYLLRGETDYCFCPNDSEKKRLASRHEKRVTPIGCGNKPGSNRTRKPKRKAGDKYTPDSYRRAVQRGAKKAGLLSWHPNQLRHSAATQIRSEFGLEAAQVTLGHAKMNTTEAYAERDLTKAIDVARRIG